MKLFHLGDLHLGRRVGEFSLIDDQADILNQLIGLSDEHKPDAILLAGDIYDKSVPSGEAMTLFDDFLTSLSGRGIKILIVSGNHDSPERLNFGSRLMARNGVYLAGTFSGILQQVVLQDAFGPVCIHLLPFIKPRMVTPYFADREMETYDAAIRAVISAAAINSSVRNVLVAHQFITCNGHEPERSESETIAIGGLDNIDVSAFDGFDYVALGHLHGPQMIGHEHVRYAGSPLKYSFSEARQHKSVTVIDLKEKGNLKISLLPLKAIRDLREIKGPLAMLLGAGRDATQTTGEINQDYIRAILTDEEEVFDAVGQLRLVYPNLMRIDFENSRTCALAPSKTAASGDIALQSPMNLFAEFYANQNNVGLSEEQIRVMIDIFETAGGDS